MQALCICGFIQSSVDVVSITKQRVNNILVYFINFMELRFFTSFNFKNLCNLTKHKCNTPCWWHRNVEKCRSIQYIERYCCDIYGCNIKCAFVGYNKNCLFSFPSHLSRSSCLAVFRHWTVLIMRIAQAFYEWLDEISACTTAFTCRAHTNVNTRGRETCAAWD